jgi:hypothetical protein
MLSNADEILGHYKCGFELMVSHELQRKGNRRHKGGPRTMNHDLSMWSDQKATVLLKYRANFLTMSGKLWCIVVCFLIVIHFASSFWCD